ncbi:MAG: SEC10/PgrA surface exclusion domain-containing protein, partial [Enterococcus hulanensis]
TEKDIKDTQAQIDAAKGDQNTNKIVLPDGFDLQTYLDYANGRITEEQFDKIFNGNTLGINQEYVSNASDKQKVVDYKNLSDEQKLELSLFAAGLINDIRKQAGVEIPVTVTQGAVDFANDINTRYDADQWDLFEQDDHYVAAIKAAATKYGLLDTGQYYENLGAGFLYQNKTMDDLKRAFFNTILFMLFNDKGSDYGHTRSLMGFNNYYADGTIPDYIKEQYFAVSLDSMGQTHFQVIRNHYIRDASKFDTTAITAPSETDTTALEQKLNDLNASLPTLKETLDAAMADVETAKAELADKTSQYEAAKTAAETANQALSDAQAKVVAAEESLKNAQAALELSKENAEKTQAAVDNYSADQATKQAALEDAQEALATEEAKLATLKNVAEEKAAALTDAQKTLDEATAAVTDAKVKLTDEQKKLDNVKKAREELVKAMEAIPAAEQALADAKKAYEQAQAKLAEAKSAQNTAKEVVDARQKELDAAKAAYDQKVKELNTLIQQRDTRLAIEAEQKRLEQAAREKAEQEAKAGQEVTDTIITKQGNDSQPQVINLSNSAQNTTTET